MKRYRVQARFDRFWDVVDTATGRAIDTYASADMAQAWCDYANARQSDGETLAAYNAPPSAER